ncbi:MAG: hypothetical protein EBT03_07400 [Betaproteobacteria bacterium]|nr:hypothetical protein [Betaproteobacteria bacterium]
MGSMWKTSRPSWIITGAWEGTELFENLELEGEDIAYISPTAYRPSEKGQSRPVPAGAIAVYLGSRRITEWDGKGWARPTRMTYLVDGMLVAAVSDIFMPL